MRDAASCLHGLEIRRNSFAGLVERNRCVSGEKIGQDAGNDSANDAWLSQTADGPQDHADSRP